MKMSPSLLVVVAATMLPLAVHADDIARSWLFLRFPEALGHLSFYGDVSALSGASAASKWESSPNPANKAWGFQEDFDWRVSANYNNISFENDTQFNFTTETAAFDVGDLGVLRLGLLQATSNEAPVRTFTGSQGMPFGFEANGVQLSWGKKLTKTFSLGAEMGFTRSETNFKMPELTVFGINPVLGTLYPIRLPGFDYVHTDKDSYSFRLGSLWSPADKWFVGMYGDYVSGTGQTTVNFSPFANSPAVKYSETVQQWVVHPGIAYEFAENAMIHLDYEAGWTFDKYQTFELQRFAMGTDIPLAKFLYLRAGVSLDLENNFSWSTGIGFYPSKHVSIDLAFQNDSFPELKQEFGRAQTLNASISIQW